MKLKEVLKSFHDQLDIVYGEEEVKSFFFILISAYFNVSRMDLALNPDYKAEYVSKLEDALKALKANIPIQYILGETDFFGMSFNVNKNVLIPRPETEELVEWIINEASKKSKKELNILDIGTGSGCIAISLARNIPNAKIYALDVSEDALEIAKINAKGNNVNVEFIKANILTCEYETIFADLKFDIIVSNPPYVRNLEKELMQPNVLENEPHLALFVEDDNPLIFYKSIADFSSKNLMKDGSLFFEINEYLGGEMIQLLNNSNFKEIQLKQDFLKKDRMIKGQLLNG